MGFINGARFSKATNQRFQGKTAHNQRVAEATSPSEIEKETLNDTRARDLYDDFVQLASIFVEHSEGPKDLSPDPEIVNLLKTSHSISSKMAEEVGVGPIGLILGAFKGYDTLAEGPSITGTAVLREAPAGSESALDRIVSLTTSRTESAGHGGVVTMTHHLSRDKNQALKFEYNHHRRLGRGPESSVFERSSTLTLTPDGVLEIER